MPFVESCITRIFKGASCTEMATLNQKIASQWLQGFPPLRYTYCTESFISIPALHNPKLCHRLHFLFLVLRCSSVGILLEQVCLLYSENISDTLWASNASSATGGPQHGLVALTFKYQLVSELLKSLIHIKGTLKTNGSWPVSIDYVVIIPKTLLSLKAELLNARKGNKKEIQVLHLLPISEVNQCIDTSLHADPRS